MALIQCPECGNTVSDRADKCPNCGCPISQGKTSFSRQQTNNGVSLTAMTCPSCGSSDIMRVSKDMAVCKTCGKQIYLEGVNLGDETVESILTFQITKDDFHRKCMNHLMSIGEEDVFSQMSNIKVKQYYMWVRQFGVGDKQDFYPMDSYGESMFKKISGKTSALPYDKFNEIFPKDDFKSFRANYLEDAVEVKNREYSPAEVMQKYTSLPKTNGYSAYPFYYCIPVFEESFEYKGKTYYFYGDGTRYGKWFACDDVPKNKHIADGPKYTRAYPLMYTVIGIMCVAALIAVGDFVISAFSDGFMMGVFYLIITGVILSFVGWILVAIVGIVGAAISGVFALVDLPIQKSINAKRRTKYRAEYERIQKRKQEEARHSVGLELPYVVPEFPIP